MRILVVSISAPPKNSPESFQTGRYIQELAKHYEISLLTTNPQRGWAPEETALQRYLTDVYAVYSLMNTPSWLRSLVSKFLSGFQIPDDNFFFHWQACFLGRLEKPDCVISRSVPFSSAVMALKLKKRFNVPWIMHLSDPWVENPFQVPSKYQLERIGRLELECFEEAEGISVTSDKTKELYQKKYPEFAHKIFVLSNVIERSSIVTDPVIDFSNKLRFVFTGRLYGARTLTLLIDAIGILNKNHHDLSAQTEFIFSGFFDEVNQHLITSCGYSNVYFLGHRPHEEALALQRNAHVLILIDSLEQDPKYDVFFPSKLLEYFAARKKIIAITRPTSTVSSLIDNRTGKCFSDSNGNELAEYMVQCCHEFNRRNADYFLTPNRAVEYLVEDKVETLIQIIESFRK